MQPALNALMLHLIDYAGMFPPARQSLAQAFDDYNRFRLDADAWMLGRFIVSAADLPELGVTAGERFRAVARPIPLSVLSALGADADDAMRKLQEAADAINTLERQHKPGVDVQMIEMRLPDLPDQAAYNRLMVRAIDHIALDEPLVMAFEIARDERWEDRVRMIVTAIAEHNARTDRRDAFKVRTGGTEAAAFPSAEQLALAVVVCRDAAVPFKATAGLHHPFYHKDETLGVRQQGFINLFAAGVLAHVHSLSWVQTETVLVDKDPANFRFDAEGFTWGDFRVTLAQIKVARQQFALSYGSCSFDEPRDDLRALGWMNEA